MSGSKEAAEKRRKTMETRYGKNWKDLQKRWGRTGGIRTAELGTAGFQTMTSSQKSEAGRKGYEAMIKKAKGGV